MKRFGGIRGFLRLVAPTVVVLTSISTASPALAGAASPPSIESESVSNITSTDATLEALINPGDLETTYEFRLETLSCWEANPGATCDFAGEGELGGTIPAGSSTQAVSVDIAEASHDLSPHTRYVYSVHAINSAGDASGSLKEFETLDALAPSVESESVSHVTPTDATLEAQINPQGAPAGVYYQFQLVTDPSEYASEILCPPTLEPGYSGCIGPQGSDALPIGFIPSNSANPEANSPVSLDLASAGVTLQPGTTYHYRVLVARRVQTEDTIEWEPPTVYGADQTFTTPVGTVPSIDSESVSHITPTDATLEAQINPESLERGVHYQFQVVTDMSEYASEFACHPGSYLCLSLPSDADALPIGFVPAGLEDQSVNLDLASAGMTLHPRTTYHYRVIAARAVPSEDSIEWEAPIVYGPDQTFTTSPSPLDNAEPSTPNGSDSATINLKSMANAQKLAQALKVCEKKPRKQRARCRRQAHKRYAHRSKLARIRSK